MGNFYKIFLVLIIVGFGFAAIPAKNAQAVNCIGKGIITYSTDSTSLNPGSRVILSASFKWGTLSSADIACLDENISINFLVFANGNYFSLSRVSVGKVGIGGTRFASHELTHARVLANPAWLSVNGTKLDTFARAENQQFPVERNDLAVVVSSHINIDFLESLTQTFACVAGDGKYACSNLSNCSDVPSGACAGLPTSCLRLSDARQCGQLALAPGGSGGGGTTGGAGGTGGGGTGGGGIELPNPIGINTFGELVKVIGLWIFNLAIPIAVIVIIYAGILMLTAGGNPGKFQKGAKALWYAVLGLAIVFIGEGFVTLIESILSLRNP
ncbi:MAG: hypothetical protein HYX20_01655 [Candidatus Yanofskybacteria bacterium]|nr:hypothetical protein [Candidatus Yanofskybacteria bacterium]